MNAEINNLSKHISIIILILVNLCFLLSDWMISLFTFSDFLMLIAIGLILIQKINLTKKDSLSFLVVEGFLILHIIFQMIFNDDFIVKIAVTNLIKILYYHTFVVLTYKYVQSRGLEKKLLQLLNLFAVISIIIGGYITLVIIFDLPLPYEFIWSFTRSDKFSYTFRRLTSIIRTRSLFSEPAHLGFYLNIILSFNMFSKFTQFIPNYFNLILILGIVATLSYSSIGILSFILFIYFFKLFRNSSYNGVSARTFVMISIALIILFLFKDFLYGAIYVRTIDILSGNDGSFINRIFNSWTYIESNELLLGNGLGHTPAIQNIYAYLISDLGIIPFMFSIIFTVYLIKFNYGIGLSFLLLNFSKGGYLSPIFSLYILFILIYVEKRFVRQKVTNTK